MPESDQAKAPPARLAVESIGVACARAAAIATVMGLAESGAVSHSVGASVAGMGLATSGLWFPTALILSFAGAHLTGITSSRQTRLRLLGTFAGALALAALFASRRAVPAPVRAAPVEAVAALAVAWGIGFVRLERPFRRPAALAGLVIAAGLQLYSTRWVDAHRAFAGEIAQGTFIPRLMLRSVLRRLA